MRNAYRIDYKMTGRVNDTDYVYITDGDKFGEREVHNIADAIGCFEALAEKNWKTFENKNAIVNIKVEEW